MPLHLDDDCFCFPRDRRVYHDWIDLLSIESRYQQSCGRKGRGVVTMDTPCRPLSIPFLLIGGMVVPSLLDPESQQFVCSLCSRAVLCLMHIASFCCCRLSGLLLLPPFLRGSVRQWASRRSAAYRVVICSSSGMATIDDDGDDDAQRPCESHHLSGRRSLVVR